MAERRASLDVVVGLRKGDEGKVKVIDYILKQKPISWVERAQGGPNAGHTRVSDDGQKIVLHQTPAGVFYPGVSSYLGDGMVINFRSLSKEVNELEAKNINTGMVFIGGHSHMIFDFNRTLDSLGDSAKPIGERVGTTGSGIGNTYGDKMNRIGIRSEELKNPERAIKLLAALISRKQTELRLYSSEHRPEFELDYYIDDLREWSRRFSGRLVDMQQVHSARFSRGDAGLIEGAQGSDLSIDGDRYPFVTSSNTTVSGLIAASGIPMSWILNCNFRSYGIQKAFESSVGEGPFVTEMPPEEADRIRDDTEEGATTGRPRRLGWFDGPGARRSQLINGVTDLVITKLDYPFTRDFPLRIADSYMLDGAKIDIAPSNAADLARCTPHYRAKEYRVGQNIQDSRRFTDLPENLQEFCSEVVTFYPGARLAVVGVGQRTSQMVTP